MSFDLFHPADGVTIVLHVQVASLKQCPKSNNPNVLIGWLPSEGTTYGSNREMMNSSQIFMLGAKKYSLRGS
jgi:hypothetical protein